MEPSEKVYDFFLKWEDQKRDTDKWRKIALVEQIKNKKLRKVNENLEKWLAVELKNQSNHMKNNHILVMMLFVVFAFVVKVMFY